MNQERMMQVLLAPHVSEKSTMLGESANQIVFRVATDATKPEIRRAVEKMFKVTVTDVTVVNVNGKRKRFGRMLGRRADWKKAYVRLAPGSDIDFSAAE